MEKDAIKSEYLSRNILCRTIAGNKCEYLTITARNHPDVRDLLLFNYISKVKIREKRSVF
jgi:hypothetical protein